MNDRAMYGVNDCGAYRPYRCALKNGSKPAYALLADLQNTISPPPPAPSGRVTPNYNSLNGSVSRGDYATINSTSKYDKSNSIKSAKSPPNSPGSPLYQNDVAGKTYNYPKASSTKISSSFNNNLSELDNLLEDLSSSKYANRKTSTPVHLYNNELSPIKSNGSIVSAGGGGRPSVDSLLDELSTALPNGGSDGPYVMKKMLMEEKTTTTTRTVRPAASSATRELDDLMASLSDFKVSKDHSNRLTSNTNTNTNNNDSSYAKSYRSVESSHSHSQSQRQENHATQLDSMLGSLQADMNKQGVNTTQKGCCSACDKPIVGQVITALGKTWHPEHFVCTHCSQELGTRNFFERDSHPYCEPDYHNLFSPRCAYCNGPILDKCVTALEKTWHTEHFFCAQCGKQFGEEGFHEREGKPYCKEDYFNMFAPKCGACFRPIMENYVSALSQQWHSSCFVCRDCRQPFHSGSFFDHEGQPYCETHYHAKRGSLCAGCHKPITGRCITAMFKKFHPEHFVCAFCLKQLNKGTFKEQNDKPYCHQCFEKLFG
ncbi:leupaxin isoform X2 [Planococcus citri]|uniref:leupaxin isoform X2 n=1 Tax=Planococcus citri TaxID=170843 RepID=UPI0031F83860